ncbi:molybdenum cofactor biosynthesis prote [Neoconidiobolus thromboides FSU 785]|nr:molybdenum cofactor biosynthesis prote [Neoconidiobolus thromboides FSU 785]
MFFTKPMLKLKPIQRLPFTNRYYAKRLNSTLTDLHKRTHNYLRISLTERCNLRCTYCMPEEGIELTPNNELLTTTEILQLAKLFVCEGVDKIRLTGGEPSIRKDIIELVAGLSELKDLGLKSIAMTSNGIALKRKLPKLIQYGLNTLNLSLDTLDPFQYQLMTRRNGFSKVMECLDEAERLDIEHLKINCVVIKGVNETEVPKFIQLTKDRKISVRFIEYMPFDGNKWSDKKLVPYKELLKMIGNEYPEYNKITDDKNDTTKHYQVNGYKGNFGFISSMTEHFCSTCNRLRITADGNLKVCLFGNSEISLRDLLRKQVNEEEIKQLVSIAVKKKLPKHAGMLELAKSKNRPMILIGDLLLPVTHVHSCISHLEPSKSNETYKSSSSNYSFFPIRTNISQLRLYSTKRLNNILSHIDPNTGRASMVDVGDKIQSKRIAKAQAKIRLSKEAMEQIRDPNSEEVLYKKNKKGDVLTVAQIAGIQGAKTTSGLIPLCHNISLDKIEIEIEIENKKEDIFGIIKIISMVKCSGKTGVEMEALMAVTIAALTIFDMCKAVDPKAVIFDVMVIHKSGGKSGTFDRKEE